MASKIERQNAAHVDVLVTDRRKPADHLIGMIAGCSVEHDLEMMGVPGHDDICQQCQGPRDSAELFRRAPLLCGDHAVMNGPLKAVDRLAIRSTAQLGVKVTVLVRILKYRPGRSGNNVRAEVNPAARLFLCATRKKNAEGSDFCGLPSGACMAYVFPRPSAYPC
jgi:hypothetical protein